jgi:hypothetical protein
LHSSEKVNLTTNANPGSRIEFESDAFEREHVSEADKCDLIVCWRDTWGRAATKTVAELASIFY